MIDGQFDRDWSVAYRQLDEGGRDDAIEHYGQAVTALSLAFDRPIDVLDVGCGTGRYFNRLRNVRRLVGVDVSPHMLEQARRPARAEQISAQQIELVCGALAQVALPAAAFDLIYSIGVMGEYAPFDLPWLQRCLSLLRPGGVLFVTVVDTASRVAVPENAAPSLLRRAARKFWPRLPLGVRVVANRWLSPHYIDRSRAEQLLAQAGFAQRRIEAFEHRSGWIGTHLDCTATKARV